MILVLAQVLRVILGPHVVSHPLHPPSSRKPLLQRERVALTVTEQVSITPKALVTCLQQLLGQFTTLGHMTTTPLSLSHSCILSLFLPLSLSL